jgi:hypothetical protein
VYSKVSFDGLFSLYVWCIEAVGVAAIEMGAHGAGTWSSVLRVVPGVGADDGVESVQRLVSRSRLSDSRSEELEERCCIC